MINPTFRAERLPYVMGFPSLPSYIATKLDNLLLITLLSRQRPTPNEEEVPLD
jgi:hypothetical protein